MRTVLTFLALALVALLTAALVAPIFIDWSRERGFIEAELSRSMGAPVSVAGAIDARLLPTPYLTLGKVHVGRGAGHTSLTSDNVRLELAIGALASGQIRFTEVSLDRPAFWLGLAPDGAMSRPDATFLALARRLELDRVIVRDGAAEFARPGGGAIALSAISLDASAKSLVGPFRGAGQFQFNGMPLRFEVVSTDFSGSDLPIKAEIATTTTGPRVTLDGALRFTQTASGIDPAYRGAVAISGHVQTSEAVADWKASGAVAADLRGASVDKLAVVLGQESRAIDATGVAKFDFGAAPSLDVALTAKQLNLDSLLRRPGEDAAPPTRALDFASSLAAAFRSAGAPSAAIRASLETPAVYLGARTLDSLKLALQAEPGTPLHGHAEFGLPGGGAFAFTGALEQGAGAAIRGRLDARSDDPRTLADWTAQDSPERSARLAALFDALPYTQIATHGDVEASAAGVSLRNLTLALDRSTLTGALVFTEPTASARGRLFLDLRTDLLDMDAAPDVTGGAAWLGDFDLSLALDAARLSIARVGQTRIDGGSLAVKASKSADKFSLDRLTLADLGGASVEAQGESTSASRWVRVKLDAARLADFAQLASRVAPGPYSRWLVRRADALSPAKMTFEARREGAAPAADAFPLDFLKAEGEAGGVRFGLRVGNAPAPVDALTGDLTLDANDGAALLRQLGLAPKTQNLGRAHVMISASGKSKAGFDASASAAFAGVDATWRGRLLPEAHGEEPNFSGGATIRSGNVAPALVALGLSPPNANLSLPADLAADLVGGIESVAANRLTGTLGTSKLAGALAWRATPTPDAATLDPDVALAQRIAGETPESSPGGVRGDLSLDRLAASSLVAAPLGLPANAKAASGWSDVKFGPPLFAAPAVDVKLRVAALDLADGAQGRNLEAHVRIDAGRYEACDVALDLPNGHLSGCATLRRDGPTAAVTGKLSLDAATWDRPALRGKFGGALDFATAGDSPGQLVAGLVGQGQMSYSGVAAARLDPGALGRVIARAQQADAAIDETNVNHQLSQELDKQPLALPDGAAAVLLSGGVLRAGPVWAPGPGRRASLSGEFDLRSAELRLQAIFEESQGGKYWSGGPPTLAVRVAGPLDAPARVIDDAMLAAGLSAQAIARESDRIANLEADLRERAAFNRRLKAQRFLQQRNLEISEFEQEQARLKFEAERKRVEDALQKADEARRAAEAEAAAAAVPKSPPSPVEAPPPPPPPAPADPAANGLY